MLPPAGWMMSSTVPALKQTSKSHNIIKVTLVQFRKHLWGNKDLDNRKIFTCIQKGEKNRGWTHWMEGDKLHLEMFYEGQVCKQMFQRA
ncbi:unnamed protein product [Nyctereutes procyonoides]|uniref:(raccoon dog) hypothetical protein n=1 Tax=Nyctereutes procyonoides TaxID=34880 RepID=A0A811ZMF5_NYCPR|nr:unnamed protein product [Nyctereutes procyonoides]